VICRPFVNKDCGRRTADVLRSDSGGLLAQPPRARVDSLRPRKSHHVWIEGRMKKRHGLAMLAGFVAGEAGVVVVVNPRHDHVGPVGS
jgi:hypothetical protein